MTGVQSLARSSEGQAMSNCQRARDRESAFPVHSLIDPYSDGPQKRIFPRYSPPWLGLIFEAVRMMVQNSLYFSLLAGNMAEKSSRETPSSAWRDSNFAPAPVGRQDFLIPRAGNQLLRSRAGSVSIYT